MKKNKKGFTLVEIIIVIGLLVVIAGIFSLNMISTLQKQRVEENDNVVSQILSAASTYVSVNPDEVENLYNGYGYVDIPIGDLRDAGLLSEELKDTETGERISDEETVRVKLDLGDYFDYTYPVKEETEAWKFIIEDLSIEYDGTYSGDWCNNSTSGQKNIYTGLVTNPLDGSYASWKSKMYLMNNKENDAERFRMYNGNYFDTSAIGINLRVTSCNVDPKNVGTYTITYKYYDPELKIEKTANRTVYVKSSNADVISFTAKLNVDTSTKQETDIVRGETRGNVPVTITETYRVGTAPLTFTTTVKDLERRGYDIQDFKTDTVSSLTATISKITPNSDGSLPAPQKVRYNVIPDTYRLTYDVNGGYAISPNYKTVTVRRNYGYPVSLVRPTRRGYTFDYWYTISRQCKRLKNTITYTLTAPSEVLSDGKLVENICDQTARAHWTPNKYTVYFNFNGGSGYPSSTIVTYDATYGSLPYPSRTGYTFLGWYTSSVGGTQVTSNTIVNIISNQTLYAHWKPNPYNVSFVAPGGYVSPFTSKVVIFDSTYGQLPYASKPGYSYSTGGGECSQICDTSCSYSYTGWGVSEYTVVKTPNDHTLYTNFVESCYTSCYPTYCPPPPPPPSYPSGGGGGGGGGGGSTHTNTSTNTTGSNSGTGCSASSSTAAIQACMQQNSINWHSASPAEQNRLHNENMMYNQILNNRQNTNYTYDPPSGSYTNGQQCRYGC